MNQVLWYADRDLGIFFTFFYCTEKKPSGKHLLHKRFPGQGCWGTINPSYLQSYFQCILIFFQESVTAFQLTRENKLYVTFALYSQRRNSVLQDTHIGYRLAIKGLILYFHFFMHLIQRKPLKILISYILCPDENSLHFCPCKHRISLLQVQVVAVPEHSHILQITGLAWMWVISW